MMWPRRPTTCTRSSPWVNSKTGVPSTYDRFTGDTVPREEASVLRGHPTDDEHGQGRTVDDRVENMHGQHGLLGLCRAREERPHRNVVGAAFRGRGLLARFPVDRDADDRTRSEDRPRNPRGWIVSSHVNAVCVQPAGELRIIVHEKRDSKPA